MCLCKCCLCMFVSLVIFWSVSPPLAPTSNATTVVLWLLISVSKWAYLSHLYLCWVWIFFSNGEVNSYIKTSFFTLSTMTTSGFSVVTMRDGSSDPPLDVWYPGRSLYTENLLVSTQFTMYCRMLLCLQVYLPWFKATLHPFRQCSVLSLFLHKWYLSENDLPHSFRLSWVGRVFVKLLKKKLHGSFWQIVQDTVPIRITLFLFWKP